MYIMLSNIHRNTTQSLASFQLAMVVLWGVDNPYQYRYSKKAPFKTMFNALEVL